MSGARVERDGLYCKRDERIYHISRKIKYPESLVHLYTDRYMNHLERYCADVCNVECQAKRKLQTVRESVMDMILKK